MQTVPDVWQSLKRTLHCKTAPSEVHDPKASRQQRSTQRQESDSGKLDCSNIKDFIHGSKRHSKKPPICSPKSKETSDILNPIIHEIVLDCSNSETKLCRCCTCPPCDRHSKAVESPHKSRRPTTPSRKPHLVDPNECKVSSTAKVLVQRDSNDPSNLICPKCGEKLKNLEAVEAHHVSEHSVTELHGEDSSWQIIETICRASWINSENRSGQIKSVLKVQNMQKTLACFEEHRKMVKANANKLQKKHPRCLADGNELLRFHGTTIACSLGVNGSSSLCSLDHCGVCRILRNGFPANKEFHGTLGVYTTSTSGKAYESIKSSDRRILLRKSVIVCRVIAGRVHSPLEEIQEMAYSEFDSLAQKISCHSDIEELYVLNPKALLPCFVVIYKP